MAETFIKLKRNEITLDLLECHPNAFLLLSLIALRARRTKNHIRNLDICECHIGDFKACGLTEQKYRTAKKVLEANGLATFRATNKGTVSKIINSNIYDINTTSGNGQDNGQLTNKQRASNEQATTNKNVKKERMKEKTPLTPQGETPDDFEKFWGMYAKSVDKKKCVAKWKKLSKKTKELIFEKLPAYVLITPDKQFRKSPWRWLNDESWNNEITQGAQNGKNGKSHNYTGVDNRPSIIPEREFKV